MTLIVDPTSRLAAVAACAGLALAAATPAQAANLNVSQLVMGTSQNPPLIPQGAPRVACGPACQYSSVATARQAAGYGPSLGSATASSWPPAYGASGPSIGSVDDTLAVPAAPAGVQQDGGAVGVARRSAVQFDWQPVMSGARMMSSQTWKGGTGSAVVSMTIRVTPTATKAHYLEFAVPQTTPRGWQEAGYVGGPSGNEPISKMPKQVQSRSAVDVYVDGLPVWSGASHILKPLRWDPPYLSYLGMKWGEALDDGSTMNLYLGQLTAGVPRTIALVFRTDLRTNADTCYTDTQYGQSYQRCDSRREGLTLPAVLVSSGGPLPFIQYRPDVRVYTY